MDGRRGLITTGFLRLSERSRFWGTGVCSEGLPSEDAAALYACETESISEGGGEDRVIHNGLLWRACRWNRDSVKSPANGKIKLEGETRVLTWMASTSL
jgi:hypothetical protein